MAEFSCEFCKAEFKDNSRLQRHLKTSKKCLSKRTPTVSADRLLPTDTETNHNNLLTKYNEALKELEEEKKEVAFIKEKLISLFNSEQQRDRIRGLTNDYTVSMYCSCGVLKFMKEEKMKEMLDDTTGNVIFKVDDNPDRFERDIFISITKKTSKK